MGQQLSKFLLGPNDVRPEAVEREIFRVAVGPLPRFRHNEKRSPSLFPLGNIQASIRVVSSRDIEGDGF